VRLDIALTTVSHVSLLLLLSLRRTGTGGRTMLRYVVQSVPVLAGRIEDRLAAIENQEILDEK